jgi:hypothetical protein
MTMTCVFRPSGYYTLFSEFEETEAIDASANRQKPELLPVAIVNHDGSIA